MTTLRCVDSTSAPLHQEIAPAAQGADQCAAGAGVAALQRAAPASVERAARPMTTCCYVAAPASYGFTITPGAVGAAARGYPSSAALKVSGGKAALTEGPAGTVASKVVAGGAAAGKTAATNPGKSTATTKTTTTKASTSSKSELAFLDDKSLSVEDKLYQFMALMTKKQDQALEAAMKSYADKKEAATKKQASGGGLLSAVADVAGGLGGALGEVGGAVVKGAEVLAKDLGGPLLASAVTAVGLPVLAPVALAVGGTLGKALVDGVADMVSAGKGAPAPKLASKAAGTGGSASTAKKTTSSSSTSASSSATSTATASDDDFDEKLEMLSLQRLVEKGDALFAALSNAMKSMHETQLSVVANIR